MSDKTEDPFGMMTLVDTWVTSMGNLWGQATTQTSPQEEPTDREQESADRDAKPGDTSGTKGQQAMAAAMKNWQAISSAMTTSESMSALLKGSGAMPDMLLTLAQSSMGSFLEIQKKTIERLNRMGESAEAYTYADIDENFLRLWTDIYEKEFRQFFTIPQLGLLRTYQEKANQVADKYNLLQSHVSEFLRLLSLPFGRSFQVLQENLGELAEKNELPEDPQAYYQMWIRILEGHFMTLFQTPEYVETMSRTINSLADYTAARDSAVEDLLSSLPVAKKTDMDDMARELYELKKRVRKLEKAQQ